MNEYINIKNNDVHYEIIYKKKKNISIKVKEDYTVLVSAPVGVDTNYIKKLLIQKGDWIIDRISKINEYKGNSLLNKEKILFSGKYLNIIAKKAKTNKVAISENDIIVDSINLESEYIQSLILMFLKKESKHIIINRAEEIANNIQIKPYDIIIKNQKSIWGSCNSKKEIRLNWRLSLMPNHILDYVIIHELCHIIHMNHSKEYWNLVSKFKPNYKECRQWLKENGALLMNLD